MADEGAALVKAERVVQVATAKKELLAGEELSNLSSVISPGWADCGATSGAIVEG